MQQRRRQPHAPTPPTHETSNNITTMVNTPTKHTPRKKLLPITRDDITVIVMLIGEASGVFAGFCPSWFTVSSPFFHEQEAKRGNTKRIRWGEAAATTIVMGTGWAVAARSSRSNLPLLASALICGIFITGYEYMIAHPATEDNDGTTTSG
jgi:hypothetical protein